MTILRRLKDDAACAQLCDIEDYLLHFNIKTRFKNYR